MSEVWRSQNSTPPAASSTTPAPAPAQEPKKTVPGPVPGTRLTPEYAAQVGRSADPTLQVDVYEVLGSAIGAVVLNVPRTADAPYPKKVDQRDPPPAPMKTKFAR